jgi:DNA-binding GntR family transcriptional regulator
MSRGYDLFSLFKEDILMLRLPPGTVFQELEIAERYGSSRTPAREAIKQLIAEGFVTTFGRRYVVKALTPADVRELYEYREGLEVTAIREQFVAGAPQGDEDAVPSFHLEIARLARNATILRELEKVHEKLRMLMRILRVESIKAIDEHERIFWAIKRRETAIAEAELRYHMRPVVAWYETYCAEQMAGDASAPILLSSQQAA